MTKAEYERCLTELAALRSKLREFTHSRADSIKEYADLNATCKGFATGATIDKDGYPVATWDFYEGHAKIPVPRALLFSDGEIQKTKEKFERVTLAEEKAQRTRDEAELKRLQEKLSV